MRLDDEELGEVKRLMETEAKIDRTYRVAFVDAEGSSHAEIEKVVQIRRKELA